MFYDLFVMGMRSLSHANIKRLLYGFRKAVDITLAWWWRG